MNENISANLFKLGSYSNAIRLKHLSSVYTRMIKAREAHKNTLNSLEGKIQLAKDRVYR